MALDVREAVRAETPARPRRQVTTAFVVSRIAVLAVTAAILLYAVPPLVATGSWVALGLLCAAGAAVAGLYLTRRYIPAKYLVPGTVFLIAFQAFPVVYTVTTAFTNFGDGHRGDKAAAITAIETGSVRQAPGSPEYAMTVALRGDELVFLLVDPATKQVRLGTADGLSPLAGAQVGVTGKVLQAPGLTVLKAPEAAARGQAIAALAVPTGDGVIKANGLSRAVEGKAALVYDAGCDCVRGDGGTWRADEGQGYFVNTKGEHLAQGWQVTVGFDNFTRVLTNPTISGYFVGVLGWNLVFALVSALGTFALGMGVALALHHPRMRGTRFYRIALILPYAMPSFAMLLVWRDMFNRDFGLINQLLGANIDWMGEPTTARLGVILVNLWLGFPYMFLVTTGALQAIPRELTEAAAIDGATPWRAFRGVTLPLLLVALTPLLISSFAFNFNNYNAIALTSEGGPFPADSPQVGATDLLITYTFRLAFGAGGAQYGFAAAISVFIFAIVALISAVAFRRTRKQEEVYA
ncbi:arabinogalactan oligomer / maltooligosaccharide transport system permease protein [Nonomuraea solani]|uniref:Maltose/maltodextrin transport system permease protein n=1 Tax=Nonomuraea solani TaxID=1144553 RepID=A0A1H6EY21_9ACTN|nr:ABC transporter permease subunit [Nonomuraea solani]SEH02303.1 arabinogalactan oligomer / maltooligosaccharide transport system permease protein [Nonomuraea solani]